MIRGPKYNASPTTTTAVMALASKSVALIIDPLGWWYSQSPRDCGGGYCGKRRFTAFLQKGTLNCHGSRGDDPQRQRIKCIRRHLNLQGV